MGLIVVFNLLKVIPEAFPDVYGAVCEYYKDKTNYYYDTRIFFYQKLVAKSVVKKIKKV